MCAPLRTRVQGGKRKVSSPRLVGRYERGAGLHAPSAAIVVELGPIILRNSGVYATACVPISIRVAVQSSGVAIGVHNRTHGEKGHANDQCNDVGS